MHEDTSYVFLFTDIEKSTETWERTPALMSRSLAIHDEIMNGCISEHGGDVVKGTGDGVMAVFDDPVAAACAAAEITRRLTTAGWGDGPGLRVRIGVHVGPADNRGGDYFGPTVNRAARLMSVASGGQVVLSDGLVASVASTLPADLGVRDLGLHRLKDLTGEQHIYQLTGEGLGSTFPPLSTLDLTPNNLPEQLSDMVGRQRELSEIRSIVDAGSSRLITLLGPGGTGKTRLAMAIAADQIDRFSDGVYFVDLADVDDVDGVLPAIARVVAPGRYGDESPLDLAAGLIGDQRILMVLDNYEQVVESGPAVIALLARCAGLTFLITTREALRVRGEHIYQVDPLALPSGDELLTAERAASYEAVALFVERARASAPGFVVDDDNVGDVVAICRRLDGLPLALELAAARLRIFDPAELKERLETRLDVLKGGRDLPERQRALEATVAWSYDLLAPSRQRMLRLLSVFSGASYEALEAVSTAALDDGSDVLDDLESLVDKSLVRPERTVVGTRYTMLETIRDFARSELDENPDERTEAVRTHAEYYADLSTELRSGLKGPERQRILDMAAVGLGNLRSSWSYWVIERDVGRLEDLLETLWALHDAQGHYHGALELASDLLGILDVSPEAEDRARAAAMQMSVARAIMAIRGYTSEVEVAFARALEMQGSTSGAEQFPVLRSLASLYVLRNETDKALDVGRQLMAIAESDDDLSHLIDAHLVLGANLGFREQMDEGLAHLDKAIELFDPARATTEGLRLGPNPAVISMTTSAFFLWFLGFPDRATARAYSAIDAARSIAHDYSLAYAIFHVAFLELWNLRLERLPDLAAELGAIARRHGFLIWEAMATVLDGLLQIAAGEAQRGLETVEQGMAMYESASAPPAFWSMTLLLRCNSSLLAGDIESAKGFAGEAADVVPRDEGIFSAIAIALGDVAMAEGEPMAALEWYDHADRISMASDLRTPALIARGRAALVEPNDSRRAALSTLAATFTEGFDVPIISQALAPVGFEAN